MLNRRLFPAGVTEHEISVLFFYSLCLNPKEVAHFLGRKPRSVVRVLAKYQDFVVQIEKASAVTPRLCQVSPIYRRMQLT